ncbi:MAG: NusG domain II-containing protein [Bacillota bacterium]|nr:NusG domain II-containing protein [Bacillota bacterium]
MKLKKYDFIVLFFLAALTILSIAVPFLTAKNYAEKLVVIQVSGKDYKSVPLNKDITIPIRNGSNYNLIVVKNNSVRVAEANCPDKLCVKDGAISKPGQVLVCLPNKVVVMIKGEDKEQIDTNSF